MSSVKRDVTVYSKGRRLETLRDRPIRLLPGGVAGVVYAGEVYPLHSGDKIDLADTAMQKALCMEFVAVGRAIPYWKESRAPKKAPVSKKTAPAKKALAARKTAPAKKPPAAKNVARPQLPIVNWNVESNRFGNYVVFDASPATAQAFTKALSDAGLGVRRWDRSLRLADDGYQYDYFARLDFDGSRDQTLAHVRSILRDTTAERSAAAVAASANIFEGSAIDVAGLVAKAVAETFGPKLQEATELADRLQKELDDLSGSVEQGRVALLRVGELEQTLAAARADSRAREKDLHARIKKVQQEAQDLRVANLKLHLVADQAHNRSVPDPDVQARLEAEHMAKQEAVEHWYAATQQAEEWEEAARQHESELEALKAKHEAEDNRARYFEEQWSNVTSELAEIRDEKRERRKLAGEADGPQQGSLDVFLTRLLPRVDLDPHSIDLLSDWPHPWPTVNALRQISDGQDPPKQKSVKGKKSWREVEDLHTGQAGQSNRGRIYWAPTSDKRVLAYVDWKDAKHQDRLIRNLPDVV